MPLRAGRRWLAAAGLFAVIGFGLDRAFPPVLGRYDARATAVLDDRGRLLDAAPARDGAFRLATTMDDVDPAYLRLLLATEDARFWVHPGVDPLALLRASLQFATRGHVVSGGSTLTMQVARLLAPHRHTVAGKLLDIVRALQLEAHFSKRRILAMYLTLAPEGGAVEGIRAASLVWFGHEPAHLNTTEAALLVAVPRSPTRLRPDRHPTRTLAAMAAVLTRAGPGAPPSLALPVFHPVPHLAPHLRGRLAGQAVRTTLDGDLQRTAGDLAAREQPWLGDDADLAVLVVRNRDRAVRAYVGGTRYFGPDGMNDMLRAARSPGSTLKPFIYGLAFDDGLIQPGSELQDSRARLGDYAPLDFDRAFDGVVTAREALQQSRNLPAVELLEQIGAPRFVAALRQAGATLRLPRDAAATLPVALGGIAISPLDLGRLYAGLADGGRVRPLRLRDADPLAAGTPLLSEHAASQLGDILRGTPLPDGIARGTRRIAYKTGTSYGFRDAWAAGWSPGFTVVIWTGRAEGTPRPGAYGLATAAPLLFHVFDLLPPEPSQPQDGRAAHQAAPRRPLLDPEQAPRIIYPPPNAALEASDGHAMAPVGLEAAGGVPPYRWLVDGVPLPQAAVGFDSAWTPAAIGFAHIAVIDAANRSAAVNVRVK